MLFPVNFQIPSPEQANSVLYGMGQTQQTLAQALRNKMLAQESKINPQILQSRLESQLLANAAQGITNQYLPQKSQSEIGLLQSQANAQNSLPGLYRSEAALNAAHGGFLGAQTNLLRQQTPYSVEMSRIGLIQDPILRRAAELSVAQKYGIIPNSTLSSVGFLPQGAGSPGNSGGYSGQPPSNMSPIPNNDVAPGSTSLDGSAPPFNQAVQQSPYPTSQGNSQLLPNSGNTPLNAPKAFDNSRYQNLMLFDSPYNPIQLAAAVKGAQTSAETDVTGYNEIQKDAASAARSGYDISKYSDQFKTNYDKTSFLTHGARRAGWWNPISGLSSADQLTDNAAQNMQQEIAQLINTKQLTNKELEFVGNIKPNRSMNPEAANIATDFLKQKSLRLTEEPAFFNTAKSRGVPWQTAQVLWQNYNTQRPVYNFNTNKSNASFKGSWSDYLSPAAIQAAQTGQTYVPLPHQFNTHSDFNRWYNDHLTPEERQSSHAQALTREQRANKSSGG